MREFLEMVEDTVLKLIKELDKGIKQNSVDIFGIRNYQAIKDDNNLLNLFREIFDPYIVEMNISPVTHIEMTLNGVKNNKFQSNIYELYINNKGDGRDISSRLFYFEFYINFREQVIYRVIDIGEQFKLESSNNLILFRSILEKFNIKLNKSWRERVEKKLFEIV